MTAVAAGALPDEHPGHHQRWRRCHGAGVADRRRHPGRRAADRPHRQVNAVAAGALPDGTPVIISGGSDGTVRVWRTGRRHPGRRAADRPQRRSDRGGGRGRCRTAPRSSSAAALRRHGAGVADCRRHSGRRAADRPHRLGERGGGRGAAGRHPGHHQRRRRRHGAGVADRRRHPGRRAADRPNGSVSAVAAGVLPDGTPVIISGGGRTARCGCGGWPTAPRSGSR